MRRALLDILACPKCQGALRCAQIDGGADKIVEGALVCQACMRTYPIRAGIPRFTLDDNYASSFGLQWNRFRTTQLDSSNGTDLSASRFFSETGWTREFLAGKLLLDAGCGAGRFLEVAAASGAIVVGLDLSNAVDAAGMTVGNLPNVCLVQASLYELPFRSGVFDACYCIGVLQHTPDPPRALSSLARILKDGGRIAVTIYERKRWTHLNGKYLVRPLTRRIPKASLLTVVRWSMPVLFSATEVLFRVPYLGRLFKFAIPVANYTHERKLSLTQRYRWAVLDTFDMLSPAFDQPQTAGRMIDAMNRASVVDVSRLSNKGLNLVGTKRS